MKPKYAEDLIFTRTHKTEIDEINKMTRKLN